MAASVFGIAIGLDVGYMIAGAFGCFVSIVLLNTVPAGGLVRRIGVLFSSSIVAGYLTPAMMFFAHFSDPLSFSTAFVIGGSAQWTLTAFIKRFAKMVSGD